MGLIPGPEGFWASLVAQLVKNLNAGDLGSIPGLGRSPGEGKGQPTPVFWPGEFHELYSPWGHKESDTTEQLSLHFTSLHFQKDSTCLGVTKPVSHSY